jgi:DUF2934 family protein
MFRACPSRSGGTVTSQKLSVLMNVVCRSVRCSPDQTERNHDPTPPQTGNRGARWPPHTNDPNGSGLASTDNDHNGKFVSDKDIRFCAYQKGEATGKPAGDGVQFWLEAEQELVKGRNAKFVQRGGWHGHREQERREAQKAVKECHESVDSHYRDNNRMFQSHGERGHRHGGSG